MSATTFSIRLADVVAADYQRTIYVEAETAAEAEAGRQGLIHWYEVVEAVAA